MREAARLIAENEAADRRPLCRSATAYWPRFATGFAAKFEDLYAFLTGCLPDRSTERAFSMQNMRSADD